MVSLELPWPQGSQDMDMVPIPEDAEVTSAEQSAKLPHERFQPCRHGRNILVAVDHGQDSRRAFQWALANLVHMADTLHLVHVLPPNCKSAQSSSISFCLGGLVEFPLLIPRLDLAEVCSDRGIC